MQVGSRDRAISVLRVDSGMDGCPFRDRPISPCSFGGGQLTGRDRTGLSNSCAGTDTTLGADASPSEWFPPILPRSSRHVHGDRRLARKYPPIDCGILSVCCRILGTRSARSWWHSSWRSDRPRSLISLAKPFNRVIIPQLRDHHLHGKRVSMRSSRSVFSGPNLDSRARRSASDFQGSEGHPPDQNNAGRQEGPVPAETCTRGDRRSRHGFRYGTSIRLDPDGRRSSVHTIFT